MSKNTNIKSRGFTIVELLIVIVVIAILAAISLVAYNGIQNRTKTSAGAQVASQVAKKATAYFQIKSAYPDLTQFKAGAPDAAEAKLADPDSVIAGPIADGAAADGGKIVGYVVCGTAPNYTGATVTHWDYAATTPVAKSTVVGTC